MTSSRFIHVVASQQASGSPTYVTFSLTSPLSLSSLIIPQINLKMYLHQASPRSVLYCNELLPELWKKCWEIHSREAKVSLHDYNTFLSSFVRSIYYYYQIYLRLGIGTLDVMISLASFNPLSDFLHKSELRYHFVQRVLWVW